VFNVSPEKFAAVALVALVVLGPDKLPQAARAIGRFRAQLSRFYTAMNDELNKVTDLSTSDVGRPDDER